MAKSAARKSAAPKRVAAKAPAKRPVTKAVAPKRTKSESQANKQKWPADTNARGRMGPYGNIDWSVNLPRLKPKEKLLKYYDEKGNVSGQVVRSDPSTRFEYGGDYGAGSFSGFSSRQGSIAAARKIAKENYGANGKLAPKPKYRGKK